MEYIVFLYCLSRGITELAFAKLGRDLYCDEMVEARSNWMAIQCDQHRCEELDAS